MILLGSPDARRKGGNGTSFLAYEVSTIISLGLPVVIANLDKARGHVSANVPAPFADSNYYSMAVSFGPSIIKYALDDYAANFAGSSNTGPYRYNESVYERLGLNK